MAATLWWTDALPDHVVLDDGEGQLWLVPVAPGGIAQRRPYHGNYRLQPFGAGDAIMLRTLTSSLVGMSEIGERLGISAGTVRQWRQRDIGFPAPVVELATGPVWSWSDVEAWAAIPRKPGPRPKG